MSDKSQAQLNTIPIKDRPPHGKWFNAIFFPIFFMLAQIGIATAQLSALPLLLIPFLGKRIFRAVVDWTKDGYGRLLIAITFLFGPTEFVITTDSPPSLNGLIERDAKGRILKINLPDRLVIMANHQAYTDWMYIWILACYSGNAAGMIILLKASLKNIPLLGWAMQFFRFIFMHRSWAADRSHLTKALKALGREASEDTEVPKGSGTSHKKDSSNGDETTGLLSSVPSSGRKRSPLWLLIFPEGTITSDEERVKSVRYAKREVMDDFITLLHPRSTGLLFSLRTLLPEIPDLQLLDVTIGYPGVPFSKYPQDHYGLNSIFFKGVPPPTVHIHLHLYTNLSDPNGEIPSLLSPEHPNYVPPTTNGVSNGHENENGHGNGDAEGEIIVDKEYDGLATPEEAKRFELWLRKVWTKKEERLTPFFKATGDDQKFIGEGGEEAREVIKVRQTRWYHWISAVGAGGFGTVATAGLAIRSFIIGPKK